MNSTQRTFPPWIRTHIYLNTLQKDMIDVILQVIADANLLTANKSNKFDGIFIAIYLSLLCFYSANMTTNLLWIRTKVTAGFKHLGCYKSNFVWFSVCHLFPARCQHFVVCKRDNYIIFLADISYLKAYYNRILRVHWGWGVA